MRIDRLNALIENLRAEPEHYVMSNWINSGLGTEDKKDLVELKCGTAGCLGGWLDSMANVEVRKGSFILPDTIPLHTLHGLNGAAAYLEINEEDPKYWELDNLFMMDRIFDMERFDKLPAEDRAKAGIRAVEIFRDTGSSDWRRALEETGLIEEVEGDDYDDYDD